MLISDFKLASHVHKMITYKVKKSNILSSNQT